METGPLSIQCKAKFSYRVKATIGGSTAAQEYGDGILSYEHDCLNFRPSVEPKIQGGMKGGLLKSLASTNIKIYPYPIVQYRDIKEFKVDKKKTLDIVLHQPYSVNPLTGEEILAIPSFETEMILSLKFNDNETRDHVHGEVLVRWEPARRSVAEVGYGAKSPSVQPATVTTTSTAEVAGYCKNCGEPYAAGQKFCGKCGNGLS